MNASSSEKVVLQRELRHEVSKKLTAMYQRFWGRPDFLEHYAARLAIEASLGDVALGGSDRKEYVVQLLVSRGQCRTGPFNSLNFRLYLETGRSEVLKAFVEDAASPLGEAVLSVEGAWLHPRGRFGAGHGVLIDSFQEEASRVAKLAWLIRRGETFHCPHKPDELERIVLDQFRIHQMILRDPDTGLWHNGRGWIEGYPELCSPGYWSRGHGWLLRGMMEAYEHMADESLRNELADIVRETAGALMAVRGKDGMWRAIMTGSPCESPAESSGSAMITASLLRAVNCGLLPERAFLPALLGSAETLFENFLTPDGVVLSACHGPGPLISTDGYLSPAVFAPDDIHGIAAFSMLGAVLAGSCNKNLSS